MFESKHLQYRMLKPDMTSGVFRIWQREGHGERVERESITGVWAEPPAGSRARAPGRGFRGAKPPEVETLFASECSMETTNSPFLAKNAPFYIKSPVKNFHGRAKGGPSHRAPPLKYATAHDC